MIALVAAMDAEVRSVRRHFDFEPAVRDGLLTFQKGVTRDGHDFVLALSGIGRPNARKATERLLNDFPVSAIVSFGVAGALVEGFALGEIAIATRVTSETGDEVPCDDGLNGTIASVVDELRLPFRRTASVTVDRVISEPAEKADLHRKSGAKIVEMESLAIGQVATAAGIPFAVVRAISDLDKTRLPDFSKFMQDHQINSRRLIRHLLTRPGDIRPLLHFFSVTSAASGTFARIFANLLPRIAAGVRA